MTPARRRALEIAADGAIRAKSALAVAADVRRASSTASCASGNLVEVAIPDKRLPLPDPHHRATEFDAEQAAAVHALRVGCRWRKFLGHAARRRHRLGQDGGLFRGRGAHAASADGQALIMLPEIALTDQFMRRFEARFGCPPVEWHSALSGPERGRVWRAAATGEARVIVGARSALFLPFSDLGLIVVDEEHDAGFKQDDRVHYQARDMAVVRGNLGSFPVMLASATPSIESHVNARTGRYRHVILPGRFSGASLPDVTAIDLRQTPPDKGKWLSPPLVEAVDRRRWQRGQQIAAVPQPARICAADAVPLVRTSHRMPAVHGVAG